jgi:hypothetical protein
VHPLNFWGAEVSEVFAERRLRLRSLVETKSILVQLGPVVRRDGAVSCRCQLTGFEQPISREIWGLDDVQAVQLALAAVGSELNRLRGDGKYSVEGDSDGEVGHGFQTLT